jgi:UPF0271 protein
MPRAIDFNCDLGEVDEPAQLTMEELVMPWLTSVNIACGAHAGSPAVMRQVVRLAKRHGVAVGAHPSFPDREGFGRRSMAVSPQELEAIVACQVEALAGVAALEGVSLRHVKPHGALYGLTVRDRQVAEAVVCGIRAVNPHLYVMGLAGSVLLTVAREQGMSVVPEGFADRAYTAEGKLVGRGVPGAVIHHPVEVVQRAVRLVCEGLVEAIEGGEVALDIATLCVHGDTPGAICLIPQIRAALLERGVSITVEGHV